MKFMSFNTQHCNHYRHGKIDFSVMAEAIKACDADVVGLNEMRDVGEAKHPDFLAQTEILARLAGYPYFYFAKAIDLPEGRYGNGILSRIPIEKAETVLVPDPEKREGGRHYETRCLLKAYLAGGITVLVTHFGLNPEEQENAVKTVLAQVSQEKCVLMGDFNVRPDNGVLAPIRACMKDTADCFPSPLLSFPSDAPHCKIDYIFASRDGSVLSADIPATVASDHRPHTASITFEA